MKNLISKTFLGSSAKVSLLAVAGILFFVVLGCSGLLKNRNISTSETPVTNSSTPVPLSTPKPTFKKADASKSEVPSDVELQDIVKTALLDFNDAVDKGDFTDFHKKISKTWRNQTTPEDFNQSFSEFISKKLDISNIANRDAKFSPAPSVRKDKGLKKLIAEGCYDVNPRPVKFVLKWINEAKEWKLFGIEVDTTIDDC